MVAGTATDVQRHPDQQEVLASPRIGPGLGRSLAERRMNQVGVGSCSPRVIVSPAMTAAARTGIRHCRRQAGIPGIAAVCESPSHASPQALLSARDQDRMERAMSLTAVPDDGEVYIDGMWHAGRQLRAGSGVPVAWVSDRALGSGLVWADLAEQSAESGLG